MQILRLKRPVLACVVFVSAGAAITGCTCPDDSGRRTAGSDFQRSNAAYNRGLEEKRAASEAFHRENPSGRTRAR